MSFGWLNAAMLLGLAAVALPVIAHLLSKRKYDVVEWGAMQFLELGQRTRRRIRLEELLLLALRMGVIAIVAMAMARPWMRGGLFAQLTRGGQRDVVFVLDSSYSMGWQGKGQTPHDAAIDWIHDYLETLSTGDTVALLDARSQVRPVIRTLTANFSEVRRSLDTLPQPSGTSDLTDAIDRGLQILSEGTTAIRELVVLTDGQALPWRTEDEYRWARLDDIAAQAPVPPALYVVNLAGEDAVERPNFALSTLDLSRELTVPDFPVRIRSAVRQSGGEVARRRVHLEINGQPLQDRTLDVNVPPDGDVPIEFEYRFPAEGSYVISLVLDEDDLPGDDRAEAAVTVEKGIPVLLIDGDPQLDPVKRETFFVASALSASGNDAPWVRAAVVDADEFSADDLRGIRVLLLANVPRLISEQVNVITEFVQGGGGLVIAPGDRVDAEFYNDALLQPGTQLLPARLAGLEESGEASTDARVDEESLTALWLQRFRGELAVDFPAARWDHWWKLEVADTNAVDAPSTDGDRTSPLASDATDAQAAVVGRFTSGDPFLVTRRLGEGAVILLAGPLDNDWSTLPSKNDFVPFLHEMVFQLAAGARNRNVPSGTPLLLPLDAAGDIVDIRFIDPAGKEHSPKLAGTVEQPLARMSETGLPGVYRAVSKTKPAGPAEFFVVNFERRESDLTPLAADQVEALSAEDRLQFVESVDELVAATSSESPPTEIWKFLLLAVLALLVGEVALTRRLVQGGHESVDADQVEESMVAPNDEGPAVRAPARAGGARRH
ncbi:BatA domain-containing protein [Maioricimonas sp. JC845]|uniref:BatA domain-containing protein n=1 Tax=Maioricimonas sp. JC845 TaxID=3232138 RepID=UPI003457FCB7